MTQIKKTRSELKRQAILEAAMYAFKEYGVQATSMDRLAEIAQVSKRTVYNHFATKEVLVMHLVSDLWQNALVQTTQEYDSETPLVEQLASLVKNEIDLIGSQEYIDLSRVAFGHLFYHPEELQKELTKIFAQETAVHRWLKAAIADNKLVLLDVEFANNQLHNLIKGSCFWPQLLKAAPVLENERKEFLVTETVAMFLSRYQA